MTTDEWRQRVDGRLTDIEKRITLFERDYAVDQVHRENVEKRLNKIDSSLVFLVRLVIGSLLGAAITFALNGGFVP